jgi:hypothetical protein
MEIMPSANTRAPGSPSVASWRRHAGGEHQEQRCAGQRVGRLPERSGQEQPNPANSPFAEKAVSVANCWNEQPDRL